MTPPSLIPYRFRPVSALRYLDILLEVQNGTIARRRIDPFTLGLSAETCTCRLRDSVTSFLNGHTTHPSIDPTILKAKWSSYFVTHDGATVYVVPKGEKKTEPVAFFTTELVQQGQSPLEVTGDTAQLEAVLRACALLLSLRILRTPVRVSATAFPDSLRTELTTTHDIALRNEGDFILMI